MNISDHNEYLRNVLAAQKALTGDSTTLDYLSRDVTQEQLLESNDIINQYLEGGVSEDVHGVDPDYDYSQTKFGIGILGVTAAVLSPLGMKAISMIDKTLDFDPIAAAKEAFENLGKPPDPNQTIGDRFAGIIDESKFSDPNRDPDEEAYGALGTADSYSLPGTSFALGISDADVVDMTEEEAVGKLKARETFESTTTESQRDTARENAANIGRGTDAAAAAARGKGTGKPEGSGRGGTGSSGSLGGGMGTAGGYSGTGEDAQAEAQAASGGRIGALIQHLQTGGEANDADTNMEVANVPMGVVNDADGAPSPFSGGTGVEDDLDMEVEAGSYVLNAESVQLIGISDINAVIRDAYSIAVALGKEVPADYDPQNKVPIRISNGEAVIPKALVEIIGLDKLEKWNKKGLQLRKQKEKMMAEQQQAQPPQQQQVASEAPMQQQMGQLMDRGGEVDDGGKVQNFFDDSIDTVKNPENMTREELENLFRTADTGPEGPENINKDIIIEEKEIPLPISKPESPLTGLAIEKLKRGIQGTVDQADDLLIKGLEKIQSFSLKEDKSRGMRNKNPFNISFITSRNPNRHGASAFHGVTGTDRLSGGTKKENRRFYLQFNNIDNGLRAGARTLRGKKYNGKTLEDIIKTFSSTDQKAYINFVTKKLNVKPDTIINTDKDDIILEKLMKAMLEFESTKKALEDISDEQIKNAIQRSKEDLPDSNYYRK